MLAFQTGVRVGSRQQSENSTRNFLYAIGAHSDYSECAPLFYKYAILRDRNTDQYDTNTIVNKYFI